MTTQREKAAALKKAKEDFLEVATQKMYCMKEQREKDTEIYGHGNIVFAELVLTCKFRSSTMAHMRNRCIKTTMTHRRSRVNACTHTFTQPAQTHRRMRPKSRAPSLT